VLLAGALARFADAVRSWPLFPLDDRCLHDGVLTSRRENPDTTTMIGHLEGW
jgi:hypothetical protein